MTQFIKDMKKAQKLSGAETMILVPGNHELGVEVQPEMFSEMCEDNGIILLIHEELDLNGYKVFGTPYQPRFGNWAFNLDPPELARKIQSIPNDTEILITHSPPKNILDFSPLCGSVGCTQLKLKINEMEKLKLHCFGHIHHSRGTIVQYGKTFVNGAILTDDYNLNPEDRRAIIVELEDKVCDSSG